MRGTCGELTEARTVLATRPVLLTSDGLFPHVYFSLQGWSSVLRLSGLYIQSL